MTIMNHKPSTKRSTLAAQRPPSGFTLIELMIAIVISLMMLVALVALLLNINRNNTEMAKTSSQIENGRFATQVLQSGIMQAGFWGHYAPQFADPTMETAPTDVPTAIPDPCLAYGAVNWNAAYITNLLGIPVDALDAAPGTCADVVANKKADTDVLVVRHAETCVSGVGSCTAPTAGQLYFQSSLCENEINADLRWAVDNNPANLTLKNRGCTGTPPAATVGTVADVRKFVSNIYYIRDYASTVGDGIPTLVRSRFELADGTLKHQAAEALIEGIEDLRVELGIDNISDNGTDTINDPDPANRYDAAVTWLDPANRISPINRGDGNPDSFVRCTTGSPCTAAQLTNVVAVKLYLLARTRDTTAGYTDTKTYTLGPTALPAFGDGYKRHVFSNTVRLTNISGRRETP